MYVVSPVDNASNKDLKRFARPRALRSRLRVGRAGARGDCASKIRSAADRIFGKPCAWRARRPFELRLRPPSTTARHKPRAAAAANRGGTEPGETRLAGKVVVVAALDEEESVTSSSPLPQGEVARSCARVRVGQLPPTFLRHLNLPTLTLPSP